MCEGKREKRERERQRERNRVNVNFHVCVSCVWREYNACFDGASLTTTFICLVDVCLVVHQVLDNVELALL